MMLSIIFYIFVLIIVLKIFKKLTTGQCKSKKCLVGKTAIVTGGNSGLGFETALDLASRGCKVIIADINNSEQSVAKIKEETGNENIYYKFIDLGSLNSVRKFAEELKKSEDCLDILINNAGSGGFVNKSEDGLLKTIQINYLGHFLLTHLLIDLLKKRKNSRIVFVSSILAYTHTINSKIDINKIQKSALSIMITVFQYGNSKLCMIMASDILSEKLSKYGIICNSVYPGLVHTNIFDEGIKSSKHLFGITIIKYAVLIVLILFGKTPREGAQTTLHCALEDNIKSGEFYVDCCTFFKPTAAKNKNLAREIWEESEKLTKLKEEEKLL